MLQRFAVRVLPYRVEHRLDGLGELPLDVLGGGVVDRGASVNRGHVGRPIVLRDHRLDVGEVLDRPKRVLHDRQGYHDLVVLVHEIRVDGAELADVVVVVDEIFTDENECFQHPLDDLRGASAQGYLPLHLEGLVGRQILQDPTGRELQAEALQDGELVEVVDLPVLQPLGDDPQTESFLAREDPLRVRIVLREVRQRLAALRVQLQIVPVLLHAVQDGRQRVLGEPSSQVVRLGFRLRRIGEVAEQTQGGGHHDGIVCEAFHRQQDLLECALGASARGSDFRGGFERLARALDQVLVVRKGLHRLENGFQRVRHQLLVFASGDTGRGAARGRLLRVVVVVVVPATTGARRRRLPPRVDRFLAPELRQVMQDPRSEALDLDVFRIHVHADDGLPEHADRIAPRARFVRSVDVDVGPLPPLSFLEVRQDAVQGIGRRLHVADVALRFRRLRPLVVIVLLVEGVSDRGRGVGGGERPVSVPGGGVRVVARTSF
mmetsp:Transcript_19663/g.45861  ORF Transcript_19663/g.45861 Transcript_19663/m.45861 type:complete len:491 (-) Transcript_19663:395-1867(-)